ncbi:MAG TPA: DEAD/DEAH box helicase [Pyrinomonadaceae bacterium]|nr:DEAD/DEAH box helicase [Pyrinomonadaceae bacterium]
MNFTELGLLPELARTCASLGYTEPTPIQTRAIPIVLSGSDLIGCAETGTGKTAAFLLPILQRLYNTKSVPGIRALIIAPTRELALQTETAYGQFAMAKSRHCVAIIGGASMQRQRESLRRGAGVVIATPGRLLDHFERGSLDLSKIEVLVLDEADRMLDMGFWPTISRLLAELPKTKQTLLFSATMSAEIEKIARSTMRTPKLVEVNTRGRAARTVSQFAYPVAVESKTALLLTLLEREREPFERVLVFTRTRRGAERLSHILRARDHSVNRIHADRSQPQREAALRDFKAGQTRVMVATDIAARGLDVTAVSHVINYDVPRAPEDYVHRVGRSGRAGKEGQAITLVTPAEEPSIRDIERLTGQPIERVVMPNFGGSHLKVERAHRAVAFAGSASGRGLRSFRPRRARYR